MALEAGLQGADAGQGARAAPQALAGFVRYLEEAGLVELRFDGGEPDSEEDWDAVDNMARLQALVMLGNRLGLGLPYGCDGYAGGPFSEQLAEDAHALSGGRAGQYGRAPASVPGSFRRAEFEALVGGRDVDWLVAASKLADLRDYRSTRALLVDSIVDHEVPGEPAYTEAYVSSVLGELERAGLAAPYPRPAAAPPPGRPH